MSLHIIIEAKMIVVLNLRASAKRPNKRRVRTPESDRCSRLLTTWPDLADARRRSHFDLKLHTPGVQRIPIALQPDLFSGVPAANLIDELF